ncbi:MAG TPA: hypothetical protein VN429_00650 [Methanospirillum sp.]|uniref:hypothetical protein n=1 Tax=Methanospirillum sp. TaxID=45200 RepID=UPI002C30EB6A|nr:hypothetical protein [Methanospirillum sp.]HWQ62892.1 hypothetical protein [Methanospirillum sp.]
MAPDDQHDEILATLNCLFTPGHVIEIRILSEDGVSSGYFDNFEKAALAIYSQDRDLRGHGIYVTLNEVTRDLLARRANRIKYRIGRQDQTTADSDIIRRRWLPIDIDPVRKSGISSSDTEHDEALLRAEEIRKFLLEKGWKEPILADSGNGAHLLYAIDLPNDDVGRDLVRSVLGVLDQKFSDEICRVDTANFNASRIWKVYGTTSRKGDNLPDRPHRRAKILSPSGERQIVTASELVSLITECSKNAENIDSGHSYLEQHCNTSAQSSALNSHVASSGESSILDLGSWLTTHGLSYTSKPYQGGILFSLHSCPFSDAHQDGAFAIQFENGAIFAGCHHDSCGSGRQRWHELRKKFEPGRYDFETRIAERRRARIKAKLITEGRIDPDDEIGDGPAVENRKTGSNSGLEKEKPGDGDLDLVQLRAQDILANGDPLAFILETFACSHEGDQRVAECLVHSLVSRSVINSKGLHVSITGESGKGKSHAIETMKSLIPPALRLEGRMSDKALFYMDDLMPGTVITLDDVNLSDQMQEILKGVTTSFQKPFPYRTVSKDRKPQICTIPQRCVWWIAKVEGAGDDQVFNRMLTCWIDDSEMQDEKVLDRTLAAAGQLPGTPTQESEEVRVCRKIWDEIEQVWVVIPFATRIRFQSSENRRNPDMLLDLIRTNAALCQKQREQRVESGINCVIATECDFTEASRLFMSLNSDGGGQAYKLTKRETALLSLIASLNRYEVTVSELQRETGWTNSNVNKLLHGYRSHGKSYSGLLEKCPAISYLDRTESRGDGGCTTYRRSKAYIWDSDLYTAWKKGGLIWLARDETGDDQIPPDDNGGAGGVGDARKDTATYASEDPGSSQRDSDLKSDIDQNESANPDVNKHGTISDAGVSIGSLSSGMFVSTGEFPVRTSCCVCGKRPSQYRERVIRNRESDHLKPDLMLCNSCYQRVVSREAAEMIALPGIIDTSSMARIQNVSQKCDLCSLKPAVWVDPHSRTHLCDSCYQREVKRTADDALLTGTTPP